MSAPSLQLSALLAGVEGAAVLGEASDQLTVAEVRDDSRQVAAGDLFLAVPGNAADGRSFLAAAVQRGARVVVVEGDAPPAADTGAAVVVTVPSMREALWAIARNRYGAPDMDLMAVTGTNGKTTTTYLVEAMLDATGLVPGVIGTVSYRSAAPGWHGGARAAALTTPGALALHGLFAEMRAAGTTDVVLEASSHALDQRRLDGCRFRVAALTNLTQDHLDYHATMDRYFQAKAGLFERLLDPARGVAVFLIDDDAGRKMRRRVRGPSLGITLKTAAPGADIAVAERQLSSDGTRAVLETPVGRIQVASSLVGEFNLANIALAAGMGVARGLPPKAIAAGLQALAGVPGRLEVVKNDRGVLCVVDYAHTPDALERAIAALRPLTANRLLVVFGCGGDRDRGKRPLMGEVAARDGDVAIVTSDNPRTEDPDSIVDMVVDGARRALAPELSADELATATRGYFREVDRRAAIKLAAAAARPGDVLLIAGKGHEDYQILGTTRVAFDDRVEARAALANGAPS